MTWLSFSSDNIYFRTHSSPRMVLYGAVLLLGLPMAEKSVGYFEVGENVASAEFSARLIWELNGRRAKAQLFVKGDRYRIEHLGGIPTELGYAGVTIVRLAEQKVWYILSERRTVISVPLTSAYLLPFSVTLEGEVARTLIGDSVVGDRPAILYEVEVDKGTGKTEKYFQWVDVKQQVLLKLVSQERDWFVEYQHVVLSPQPDFYFEAPLGYRLIEAQEAQVP